MFYNYSPNVNRKDKITTNIIKIKNFLIISEEN